MPPFPTPSAVQAIAAMPDGAMRNRAITAAYFELSTEMVRRFPGAANWCTFATWASRQAGVTIRHEDLLEALRQRLRGSAALRRTFMEILAVMTHRQIDLVELVTHAIGELGPLRRAGDAVARGNRKVFEEIGLEFARFVGRFDAMAAITDVDFSDFVSRLRDGDPPDGQRLLRQAFRAYRSAAMARNAQERAEWLLFANLSIGYHEQVRLQPEIREALDAAVIDKEALVTSILDALRAHEPQLHGVLRNRVPLVTAPLRALARRVAAEVSAIVRAVVTEHLMTLRLDTVVVRLGQDVQQVCPPELQRLQAPELLQLMTAVDPDPNGPRGSGAEDWADFAQRMHFIAELFRAWQHDERVFAAP